MKFENLKMDSGRVQDWWSRRIMMMNSVVFKIWEKKKFNIIHEFTTNLLFAELLLVNGGLVIPGIDCLELELNFKHRLDQVRLDTCLGNITMIIMSLSISKACTGISLISCHSKMPM